jgi:hypothetical protein
VGRSGVVCVLALLALGGCGDRTSLPQACIEAQPKDVLQALTRAPGDVALADGTRLSQCVRRAIDEHQLQALGATLTATADVLARRMVTSAEGDRSRSPEGETPYDEAAFQLGFLIGATGRGADEASGFQDELAHRIAGAASIDGGSRRAHLMRGRVAGRRDG